MLRASLGADRLSRYWGIPSNSPRIAIQPYVVITARSSDVRAAGRPAFPHKGFRYNSARAASFSVAGPGGVPLRAHPYSIRWARIGIRFKRYRVNSIFP
jgi:hypothetical protein